MNFYKSGMKLGLDIHGVLDTDPNFFVDLANLVTYKLLGEVHIITGSPYSEKIQSQLVEYNGGRTFWTHFFSVQTYMTQNNFHHVLDEKSYPHFQADEWNRVKADYCRWNKIDLHIDDEENYARFFTTPIMVYSKNPQSLRKKYNPLFKD